MLNSNILLEFPSKPNYMVLINANTPLLLLQHSNLALTATTQVLISLWNFIQRGVKRFPWSA